MEHLYPPTSGRNGGAWFDGSFLHDGIFINLHRLILYSVCKNTVGRLASIHTPFLLPTRASVLFRCLPPHHSAPENLGNLTQGILPCLLYYLLCVHGLSHSVMSNSFVTPWTVAHQAPLSVRFPRQEYWSGLPFPSPTDLPDPGVEPMSPVSSPEVNK